MPTYEWVERFGKDFDSLSSSEQQAFLSAVEKFVADLTAGREPRKGLRVKGIKSAGIFEMTWAPDGRATFQYGDSVRPGEPHIIWRRVGTHDVLDNA